MKKDSFYFSHDYNARNDFKCLFLRQQLGMEGYGIYWFLIESLAESGGLLPLKIIPVLAMQMQVQDVKVSAVINSFDLFTVNDNEFFSIRLNNHLEKRGLLSKKGKEGALKRWNNRGAIGDAISNPNAKERKLKEIKVKETKEYVFDFKSQLLDFGFDEKLVYEWILIRKNKKAFNTETALNKFINQVEATGMDKNDVLRIVVENSWKGFDATWINKPQQQKQIINYNTSVDGF